MNSGSLLLIRSDFSGVAALHSEVGGLLLIGG